MPYRDKKVVGVFVRFFVQLQFFGCGLLPVFVFKRLSEQPRISVFFSTQPHSPSLAALYTPEPDICHELGHAPMFAVRFAAFPRDWTLPV
jgi:hypothetical protein